MSNYDSHSSRHSYSWLRMNQWFVLKWNTKESVNKWWVKGDLSIKDTVCIWVLKQEDRNKFMDDTIGMKKDDEKLR